MACDKGVSLLSRKDETKPDVTRVQKACCGDTGEQGRDRPHTALRVTNEFKFYSKCKGVSWILHKEAT